MATMFLVVVFYVVFLLHLDCQFLDSGEIQSALTKPSIFKQLPCTGICPSGIPTKVPKGTVTHNHEV